jgi:prohibitin 2
MVLPLLMVALDGFVIIQPGEQGVVVRVGKLTGETFGEGLHLKTPIFDNVDKLDLQIQKFSASKMQASSKDLQNVTTSCAVNYRLNPEKVIGVRRQLGADTSIHENRALQPQLQEAIKAVTARYNAQDLIAKRREVSSEMRDTFQRKLDNLIDGAFLVDEFAITNFTFSKTFNRAIEAKVEAAERSIQAENEVRQARAEAEKEIATAKGKAESVRIEAQAEADAIRLRAQAFREFPEVLKLDTIQRWDGRLPLVLGGENSDMLLNISDFATAQSKSTPPTGRRTTSAHK